MSKAGIIYPHQLFKNIEFISISIPIYLIEEDLFFNQYNFHKRKIAFHRATMKFYERYLNQKGYKVFYIPATSGLCDTKKLITKLIDDGVKELHIINPTDNWLERKISHFKSVINIIEYENPLFLNTRPELNSFFKPTKKKYFQTSFYKSERLKRNILIANGQPVGGRWTFDTDNRKKYPQGKKAPIIQNPENNSFFKEAMKYVNAHFRSNLGDLDEDQLYPTTFGEAEDWLEQFLEFRFYEFGDYEDAIVKDEQVLNHSLLSPLLNVGLLSPKQVLYRALDYASEHEIPINSLEGFIRQIMGWREFIRGVYEVKGSEERTRNFWGHTRTLPSSFYNATTGILPVDHTITKVLRTGYAHHIERLMILGNFMLLCELDPNDIYRWFMEFFIDSYDWVMVPNVYGMSTFADGGLMSTKPYISSSNYIKKMSDFPNGDWQNVWDGLFWRFMDKNRGFFSKNPRLNMLINNLDKMDRRRKELLFETGENYLSSLK
jgi:deoxyribodipyrimidine photolyase-related protein